MAFDGVSSEDLAILWQDRRDGAARAELLRRYDRMLAKMARKKCRRGQDADFEDLWQAARIGFLKGLDKWDRSFGTTIGTATRMWILDEIIELSSKRNGLGIPRQYALCVNKRLRQGMAMEESIEDTAKTLGKCAETIRMAVEMNHRHASTSDEDFREPAFDPTEDVLEAIERAERVAKVRWLLEGLPEPERSWILRHYVQDETFAEIGASAGRSRETVRLRVARAMATLRAEAHAALLPRPSMPSEAA